MRYLRSGTFWASLTIGWFVTLFFLAVIIHVFGAERMTASEGIAMQIGMQVFAVAAGVEYGRQQVNRMRKR